MSQIPIVDGLFTWPAADPRLLGSQCAECDAYTFPAQDACPRCASGRVEVVELSPRGTLWTWTSQEFLPKAPPYAGPEHVDTFERYYVGYVELPDQLRVEARLSGYDEAEPVIGGSVQLAIVPFRTDADGNEVMTYTFVPAEESAHD